MYTLYILQMAQYRIGVHLNLLAQFKNVSLVFSIEGTGTPHSYIRRQAPHRADREQYGTLQYA